MRTNQKWGPDETTVPAIDIDIQSYLHLNSQIKNLNDTLNLVFSRKIEVRRNDPAKRVRSY